MCMHEIYIYIYVRKHHMCVCMCIRVAVFVHTSPGPKYGMECIKCRCSFVVYALCLSLSFSLSRASFHVFVTQWLLPATYWSFAIHMLVRCVCVQIVDAIYVYVCVLCSCMVVVYFTQLLQGLPRLLYVYRLIYKYIHVRVHTDSAQQTHKHVES